MNAMTPLPILDGAVAPATSHDSRTLDTLRLPALRIRLEQFVR